MNEKQNIRKKICFVATTTSIINEFLLEHIELLSENFDIYIVVKLDDKIETNKVKSIFSLNIERKPNLIKDLTCLILLTKYFRKNKFDLVQTITPKGGFIGILSAFFAMVPIRIHAFTGQVWTTKTGFSKFYLKQIDKLIERFSTKIVVDSISQRNYLLEHNIISKEKSFVLGHGSICGVNKIKFNSNEITRSMYRRKIAIPESSVVYTYMGRLNREKGVLDLVESFYKLNAKFSNTKLVFIGKDEEQIQTLIKKNSQNGNIIFIPYTRIAFEYLQITDIFCLPSYREGFGSSVIEASMLSIPVICSDIYGLKESCIDGVTGLKFKPGNIDEIYNCMLQLLLNKDLRIQLGLNGQQYVSERYDSKLITKLWKDFYCAQLYF